MSAFSVRRVLVLAVFLATALVGGAGAASASTSAPYCGITWGSLDKSTSPGGGNALTDARTGQHDCYDRVVFDFDGGAVSSSVGYATAVYTQGKGDPLDIAGGAKLNVLLIGNDYDINTGVGTYPHRAGDHVANVSGYRTLRDVVYGGSFEGYTTFGIGVRARLPFRVFTLAGPGTHGRVVIDIAHRWS